MSVNHKILYVPLTKDTIYPVYVPIVLDNPEVLQSSGGLSEEDYNETIKLNESCGFPIAPLLAALAPVLIPAAVRIGKKIFGKGGVPEERLNRDYLTYQHIKGVPNPNARGRVVYSEYSKYPYRQNNLIAGYIPTNPNIRNLKQLQSLYNHYN